MELLIYMSLMWCRVEGCSAAVSCFPHDLSSILAEVGFPGSQLKVDSAFQASAALCSEELASLLQSLSAGQRVSLTPLGSGAYLLNCASIGKYANNMSKKMSVAFEDVVARTLRTGWPRLH